ncbi:MAG: hypothetical protein FWD19_02375 [Defluviitaleaceae bacterium]|nr:hypothetical protein [Defluviitaleaceae bacterium]
MANSNEKMRVLDLLESGKINATEAAELLSVLNSRAETKNKTDSEEKLRQFAKDCNQFAKEVGCKMQEMYKDVEPKVKKVSKSALEKAAAALDNLANNINESFDETEPADDEPKEN